MRRATRSAAPPSCLVERSGHQFVRARLHASTNDNGVATFSVRRSAAKDYVISARANNVQLDDRATVKVQRAPSTTVDPELPASELDRARAGDRGIRGLDFVRIRDAGRHSDRERWQPDVLSAGVAGRMHAYPRDRGQQDLQGELSRQRDLRAQLGYRTTPDRSGADPGGGANLAACHLARSSAERHVHGDGPGDNGWPAARWTSGRTRAAPGATGSAAGR